VTAEGSGARILRNTILNGIGTVSGVVIALVLTPFIIDGIGADAFGVWALAWSFSFLGGYAAMTDLGVEAAAARYVAEARGLGDADRAREVASSAMRFFRLASLVATPLVAALGIGLIEIVGAPAGLQAEARICFALIAAQLLFELPARAYLALLEGAQAYGSYQAVELGRSLALGAFIAIALIADWGLPGLGAAAMASSVIALGLARALSARWVPDVAIARRHATRATGRTLMSFGGRYLGFQLMYTLYRQFDKVIVGIALGPRPVGVFEVGARLQQGALMIQSISASAVLPAAAFVQQHRELVRELYLRGTSYGVAMSVPVAVAAFIFAPDLIRTWVGEEFEDSAVIAQLLLAGAVLVASHRVGISMLVGLGQMRFLLWVTFAFTLLNIGLSIALVGPMGVDGVALATLIAQGAVWVPHTVYFARTFGVAARDWIARIVRPNVPGIALQALTAVPLLALTREAPNLAVVGAITLFSIALGLVGYLLIGLSRSERRQLRQMATSVSS